jgi:hypothetical protein
MTSRADSPGCQHDHAHATGNGSSSGIPSASRDRPAAGTGAYEILTDEEMIEGLSFPCFGGSPPMIMVPGAPPQRSAMENDLDQFDRSVRRATHRRERTT